MTKSGDSSDTVQYLSFPDSPYFSETLMVKMIMRMKMAKVLPWKNIDDY